MNPLYSSWNNALDYSRYTRGNPSGNSTPNGITADALPLP